MNKNTKAAQKAGVSNKPEITIGTGENRIFGTRNYEPLVKGICVDSAFGAPNNKNTTRKNYKNLKRNNES